MSFELEKDMTNVIKDNFLEIAKSVKSCNNRSQLIYSYEFPIYYRMIDVVIATYCKEYNSFEECKYYERSIRKLSSKCFGILTLIGLKKKASISLIKKELLIERNKITTCLDKLCDAGLIEKVSKYSFRVTDWNILIPKEFIAIELKLTKWQEALEQGIFNQRFAEYSFVVLDGEKVHTTERIEECYKEKNVGLIYLKSNGNIDIRVIPKKNKDIDKYINQFHKIKMLKDFVINDKKWKEV